MRKSILVAAMVGMVVSSCGEEAAVTTEPIVESESSEITNVDVTTATPTTIEQVVSGLRRVSQEEFIQVLAVEDDQMQLIDLRTAGECDEHGMIDNAVMVDYMAEDFPSQMEQFDKNKKTLIYCQSGGRSGLALELMETMGFTDVLELEGGYADY